ncbi:MAG: hypothetical protein IPG91_16375 [Ideonella sp.]|nr:hypothetical protein [Ideonella sp.]
MLVPEKWTRGAAGIPRRQATGDAALARQRASAPAAGHAGGAGPERIEASGRTQALQTIAAPIGGVITELTLRSGMTVARRGAGAHHRTGHGRLEAAVPEEPGRRCAQVRAVWARFAAWPGEVWQAGCRRCCPKATATRARCACASPPNPGQRLPGLGCRRRSA